MVVLLDFTNSMATWQEGGKSGINLEVDWARELINQLASTHRMALMEYHDRNIDAGVIAPFSNDKAALSAALDQFLAQPIDHGSSRVWDALYSAVEMFDRSGSTNKERTIFFITDGKETSSEKSPSEVIALAKQWQASIFIIGTGSVANETALTQIAGQTGGEYYPAGNIESFRQKLEQIPRDLGGQYKLSYITLKRSGTYDVQVKFSYSGLSGQFDTSLDLGSIYGDDRVGVITFDSPTLTTSGLHVIVRAQHIPRNISRFRFRLDTPKTCGFTDFRCRRRTVRWLERNFARFAGLHRAFIDNASGVWRFWSAFHDRHFARDRDNALDSVRAGHDHLFRRQDLYLSGEYYLDGRATVVMAQSERNNMRNLLVFGLLLIATFAMAEGDSTAAKTPMTTVAVAKAVVPKSHYQFRGQGHTLAAILDGRH